MVHATSAAPSNSAVRARAELVAIERGEPLTGMTDPELQYATGAPNRANPANYNGKQHNQLFYGRSGRIWHVYIDGSVVRSIQNTAPLCSHAPAYLHCLLPMEIRSGDQRQ